MTIRLVVFDCDGTLVDGQAAVCDSMELAFRQASLAAPDRNAVRRIVGLSLPQAVRQLCPDASDEHCAQAVDAYKSTFRELRLSGRLHEPLYDGIADLVTGLSQSGWALGVATGKSDRGLQACLTTHGIIDLFATFQTADRHPSKPDPAMLEAALFETGVRPSDAVMIGDTTFDMAMARAANIRAIGVDWGYHTPAELLEHGAERVVSSTHELQEVLG